MSKTVKEVLLGVGKGKKKQKSSKKSGNKKHGRNKIKCSKYRAENRREKNKARKQRKIQNMMEKKWIKNKLTE